MLKSTSRDKKKSYILSHCQVNLFSNIFPLSFFIFYFKIHRINFFNLITLAFAILPENTRRKHVNTTC